MTERLKNFCGATLSERVVGFLVQSGFDAWNRFDGFQLPRIATFLAWPGAGTRRSAPDFAHALAR